MAVMTSAGWRVQPGAGMKNDDAYANRAYVAEADAIVERWEADARAFREREAALGRARLNERYGAHEREAFDLFHPKGRAAGLLVFVHGGYWRLFDRSWFSHLAGGAVARDWAVAVPSYPLAPEVQIAGITRSAARAVEMAAGFVAGPVALAGHSAGGQLVARMACEGVLAPEVAARVVRILPISPVADLRPLIETEMNADFRLDEDAAVAESPALLPKALDVPVRVRVGGAERPAFLDQARWLATAWSAELEVVPDRHHFDIVDPLADPESDLMRWLAP